MALLSPENADETPVNFPADWEEAADTIVYDSVTSPPPICVICGPPDSGKNTFSRHLLNVLVQRYRRVAYMDTDVAQPEFTLPGCLSLTMVDQVTPDLAIPCLRTSERCFFYGDITPRSDPNSYMSYINALYDHYYEQYQQNVTTIGVPLVVNTPAWVEGQGFNILVEMLKHFAPTQVVKICVSTEHKNLPRGAFWLDEGATREVNILEINSDRRDCIEKSWQAQNDDDQRLLRDVRLLAYFRKCFPMNMNLNTIEDLDHELAELNPHQIHMSTITIKQLYPEVPRAENETIYTSNSIIVGLAVASLNSEAFPSCVGLGIVRGVDTRRKILYLVTPVPVNILENVNILLQGLIKIPICLKQVQGQITG